MFKLEEVESEWIDAIGFYKGKRINTLAVKMKGGSLYYFKGVSESRYKEFRGAKKKGEFFNAKIRGAYNSSKHSGHRIPTVSD